MIGPMRETNPASSFSLARMLASLVLLLASLSLFAGPAKAGETRIVTHLTQEVLPDGFKAVLQLTGEAESHLVLMEHPNRIALDLDDTVAAISDPELVANSIVEKIRQGLVSSDRYRLVFTLAKPALPVLEKGASEKGATASLLLKPADQKAFDQAVVAQSFGEEYDAARSASAPKGKTYTVVIDPGHGGIDTGAVGKDGSYEKDINLKAGFALRDALKTFDDVKVVLTRDTDEYIPLGERAAIGRQNKADLFISLHADSIRYSSLRGATVYTLSDRASDALSRDLAEDENAADRFAGPEWQQEKPEVFDILLDLTRRETESFSERFASGLVDALKDGDVGLMKNPKRSAGFRVLKAPDVPSVLIEMGYLSNKEDEKLLKDDAWRDATAKAIAEAVHHFLQTRSAFERAAGN